MALITLYFRDDIPLVALAAVLGAVDEYDLRTNTLLSPATDLWLQLFEMRVPVKQKLSARIRANERYQREHGFGARLIRARFDSPGFLTVDGSGALEKLIDILHQGDLAKAERKAIIERIQAETDLMKAQAFKQRIDALSAGVAVFKSLGLGDEQIIRLISHDPALIDLIGAPITRLEDAQRVGILQKSTSGTEEHTGPKDKT